jgi:hypothetical protein
MREELSYESFMFKNEISEIQAAVVTDCLLKNNNLTETYLKIEETLSREKIFVFAKLISKDLIGEKLIDICPAMWSERSDMINK